MFCAFFFCIKISTLSKPSQVTCLMHCLYRPGDVVVRGIECP
jgi:hypothetical protein